LYSLSVWLRLYRISALNKEPTMLTIVVTKPEIRELQGNAKVSGRPFHMRIQTAFAYTGDPDGVVSEFPEKFELILEKGAEPYARGKYQLAPSALAVRDRELTVGSVRLVPFTAAK